MDAAAPAAPAEDAPPLLLKTSECTPWLVRDVLLAKGWREWVEGTHADDEWALCWRSGKYRPSEYVEAHRRGQRVNHFRNSGAITKKDSLLRHLRQYRAVHGAEQPEPQQVAEAVCSLLAAGGNGTRRAA